MTGKDTLPTDGVGVIDFGIGRTNGITPLVSVCVDDIVVDTAAIPGR